MKKSLKSIICFIVALTMTLCSFVGIGFAGDAKEKTILSIASAGNVNTVNADTNDNSAFQWKIGHTTNGNAAFFQYELPKLEDGETIVSAKWVGFVTGTTDKYVKLVQYDTKELLDPTKATYNSITGSADYINTVESIYDGLRVNIANGNFDKAIPTNDTVERDRLTIDMTDAVIKAMVNGNKYFTFVGTGTTPYGEIQLTKTAYDPAPQLIIETTKAPTVELVNPQGGVLNKDENTAFSISVNVSKGIADISKVVFTLTDSNGNSTTYDNPVIDGEKYTWNFEEGLEADDYTAVIKAEDTSGYSGEATVKISIKGDTDGKTETALSYVSAGNVNTVNADTNDNSAFQWKIGHTTNGNAAFFQYELPKLEDGETVVSAKWVGFVTTATSKYVKFVQYDTEELLDSTKATYNSITGSKDYINTAESICSGVLVSTENGNYDKAIPVNDTVERDRLTIDMTEAVTRAMVNGNKYFTFVGTGTTQYGEIQLQKSLEPAPQLIIDKAKIPQIKTVSPVGKKLNVVRNKPFNISADVYEGNAAISSVVLEMEDEKGGIKTYSEPVKSGQNYTWSFETGLNGGRYNATIKATDVLGYSSEVTVAVSVNCYTAVVKDMNFSYTKYQNGVNFNISKDTEAIMQYALPEIPDDADIISATWYFGGDESYYNNYLASHEGKLKFRKLINTNKLEGTPFASDNDASSIELEETPFLTTEETVGELTCATTNQTQNGSSSFTKEEGYYVQVDLTEYVKAARAANQNYYGFSVQLTGEDALLISKGAKGYYRPVLEIAYTAPVGNHTISVENGTAVASVDVNEVDAVLGLASYNNGVLVDCSFTDEVVDGMLTTSLTDTREGIIFKSFVLNSLGDIKPIVSPIEKSNSELKVLAIGNSFSVDAVEYLYQIAEDAGVGNIKIGNLYYGACSLKKHLEHAEEDKVAYTYYKNTTGSFETSESSIYKALKDEDWDIIVLQHNADNTGIADTYEPYLTELKKYVDKHKTNPEAEFAWHMTWAFQSDSTHDGFPKYDSDQLTMYNAIVDAVQSVISSDFEVIPSGTAIQNVRTSYIGDTLTRDGFHLSDPMGRYIAGLTWFKILMDSPIDNIKYTPEGISAEELALIKESVNNACKKPFEITNSSYN